MYEKRGVELILNPGRRPYTLFLLYTVRGDHGAPFPTKYTSDEELALRVLAMLVTRAMERVIIAMDCTRQGGARGFCRVGNKTVYRWECSGPPPPQRHGEEKGRVLVGYPCNSHRMPVYG